MLLRIGIWFAAVLGAVASYGQFEGDSRLDRSVTLRFEAHPVREVLQEVMMQTGVELSAADDIGNDLVILLFRDKPAADALRLIAEHFDWTWDRRGDGYRLHRTKEQREEEERLRVEAILKPYRERQKQIRDRLAKMRDADPLKARELFQVIRDSNMVIGAPRDHREAKGQQNVREDYEDVFSGWAEIGYSIYAGLDAAQLLRLNQDGFLVFSTRPNRFQLPFQVAPDLVRMGVEFLRSQYEFNREQSRARGNQAGVELMDARIRRLEQIDFIRVRLAATASVPGLTGIEVSIRFAGETNIGIARYFSEDFEFYFELPERAEKTELHAIPLPEGATQDTSPGAEFVTPTMPSRRQIMRAKSNLDPVAAFGQPLVKMLESTDVDFVSDGYDLYANCWAPMPRRGATIGLAIDTFCYAVGAEWRTSDGVVRVRQGSWAYQRSLFMPRDVFREIRDGIHESGGLTIEQIASIVARLTDDQVLFGQLLSFSQLTQLPNAIHRAELAYIRFYERLPSPQKRAFLQGEPISYATLDPVSRGLFERAFLNTPMVGGIAIPEVGAELLSPLERRIASWTLRDSARQQQEREPTQILGDNLSATSTISAFMGSDAGVMFERPYGYSIHSQSRIDGYERFPMATVSGDGEDPPWRVKVCEMQRLVFTIQLRPGVSNGATLSTGLVDLDKPYGAIRDLPKPLADEIRRSFIRDGGR